MQNEAGTRNKKWHKTDTSGSLSVPPEPETKTAAPAGPRNGGTAFERATSTFEENGYHEGACATTRAATWYACNRATCARPVIPVLKRMFGLSALEAVQAIRTADGGQA